eukprot:gene4789-5974_t
MQNKKKEEVKVVDELSQLLEELSSPNIIEQLKQQQLQKSQQQQLQKKVDPHPQQPQKQEEPPKTISLIASTNVESIDSNSAAGSPNLSHHNLANCTDNESTNSISSLNKEISMESLKPVSENSPLPQSIRRPLSTLKPLPKLVIPKDDEIEEDDETSSDSSSSFSSEDDSNDESDQEIPTITTTTTPTTEETISTPNYHHNEEKGRKRSVLSESSPTAGLLNSSSRLPYHRVGSIRLKVSQVLEEEFKLQAEFEEQEQKRSSLLLNQPPLPLPEQTIENNNNNNNIDNSTFNDLKSSTSTLSSSPNNETDSQLQQTSPPQPTATETITITTTTITTTILTPITITPDPNQSTSSATTPNTTTSPISSAEQQHQQNEKVEQLKNQVFAQLNELENLSKPSSSPPTANNNSLRLSQGIQPSPLRLSQNLEIPLSNSERPKTTSRVSSEMRLTAIPARFNRPRKESIADRWDIGRKSPRRSLTLNMQRIGEEFEVMRNVIKMPNPNLEKMLVHISIMDQSYKVVHVTEDFHVKDLVLLFCDKLGLVQTEFFSLSESTPDGSDRWLDPMKLIKDAGVKNLSKLVMKIRYFKQPKRLSDPRAIHLYYIQIQQSVVSGTYPCSEAMSLRLAALQFYITFGPYDREKHITGFLDRDVLESLIPKNFFFDHSDEYLQKRIFTLHSQIKCSSIIEAKLRYIDLAYKIPTYGVTAFQIHDGIRENNINRHKRTFCVAEDGILISRKDRQGFDFINYKEIINYAITTRGFRIQITPNSVTSNTSENMSFDCTSYEQSNNIVDLISSYMYFNQHAESPNTSAGNSPNNMKRNTPTSITPFTLTPSVSSHSTSSHQNTLHSNLSGLIPLFQPPKQRFRNDPLKSRLEIFKINYLQLCQNFHTKPIYKLIDQIDKVLDKEGSFRNGLFYENIELSGLDLRGSDLSFIADALKDAMNISNDEGENIVENLNITTLDFSNNPDLATAEAFEPLKILMTCNTIRHLNLKCIGLTSKSLMPLITIIEKYPQLETIQVGKNKIYDTGLRLILKAIKNYNQSIQTIGVDEINLGDVGCTIIERLLTNNKSVVSIDLSKNKITESGFKVIFEGLKKNNQLQEMNISGNPIQARYMNKFIKWLSQNNSSLSKLSISSTTLNSSSGSEINKVLVSNACHIRYLDVSQNNLGVSGTKNVIKGVVNNNTIQELSLSANKINFRACNELCQSLELSPTCSKLYLRYCELASKSLIRIGKMLELNTTLNTLDLSMNKISKSASHIIGQSLQKNRYIEDLYLTQCQMDYKDIQGVLKGVKTNQSLKKLFLDVNPLGKKSLPLIVEVINSNSTLEVITLRNIDITAKDILSFLQKLNTTTTIKTINLLENVSTSQNSIPSTIKNSINDQLKRLYHINIQF